MSISARCKNQQKSADRIFMDFKYTKPGSLEQRRSLMILIDLIGEWAEYFRDEDKRVNPTIILESSAK
tara:strand:+ start:268 stop:471 length:204 start_codon:yes stop_codon:yes gene_type:complete